MTSQLSDDIIDAYWSVGHDGDGLSARTETVRALNLRYGFLPGAGQTLRTFSACGPFCPWVTSYSTFWPSVSSR